MEDVYLYVKWCSYRRYTCDCKHFTVNTSHNGQQVIRAQIPKGKKQDQFYLIIWGDK